MALNKIQGIHVMTPGPTAIHESVREAMSFAYTNPDLDENFVEFYAETAELVNELLHNDGETYLLCGEGILGLEAACATFIEAGDSVLTIANGIFGKGFDDFSKMYGAKTQIFESDDRLGIDPFALEAFIEAKGPFKVATLVHCETPSGLSNPVEQIGKILRKHGILSIVDSVSAVGAETMNMEAFELDVVLSGSQKVMSAPVGISTVSVSQRALLAMQARKTPVVGFYSNLNIWKGYKENKWFPYTQPIHLIAALRVALERLVKEDAVHKHETMAQHVRETFTNCGFELYAKNCYANSVTAVRLPSALDFAKLQGKLKEDHQMLIGGGFGPLENKIFRIGHMGEGCSLDKMNHLMRALDQSFESLNVPTSNSLLFTFLKLTGQA